VSRPGAGRRPQPAGHLLGRDPDRPSAREDGISRRGRERRPDEGSSRGGVAAGERAAGALAAGVDCLLSPPDPPETVTALARLVDDGTLPGASLERALVNLESALRRV